MKELWSHRKKNISLTLIDIREVQLHPKLVFYFSDESCYEKEDHEDESDTDSDHSTMADDSQEDPTYICPSQGSKVSTASSPIDIGIL